jgi:hypothetical protein
MVCCWLNPLLLGCNFLHMIQVWWPHECSLIRHLCCLLLDSLVYFWPRCQHCRSRSDGTDVQCDQIYSCYPCQWSKRFRRSKFPSFFSIVILTMQICSNSISKNCMFAHWLKQGCVKGFFLSTLGTWPIPTYNWIQLLH